MGRRPRHRVARHQMIPTSLFASATSDSRRTAIAVGLDNRRYLKLLSLSGGSCEKPDSRGFNALLGPVLQTGSREMRAVHAKSSPSGRGEAPHVVEKPTFFQEDRSRRAQPEGRSLPDVPSVREAGAAWHLVSCRLPAPGDQRSARRPITPKYFTKRPLRTVCIFGKMPQADAGRGCLKLNVAAGLIRRKSGFQNFQHHPWC